MRKLAPIAAVVIAMGIWGLTRPLSATDTSYGHCREDQHEFAGHKFMSGPTDTVGRTCEGADGLGCHIGTFVSFYTCGPDIPAGHNVP